MHTAHFHRVRKLCSNLLDIYLYTFLCAAIDGRHKRTRDHGCICAESQCLQYINATANASVDENLHTAALHRIRNLTEHLCRRRTLIEHAAAVIADNDRCRPGLLRFACAANRHYTLDNERNPHSLSDHTQLFNCFASCGRIKIFQKRKSSSIHIHGYCKATGHFYQFIFFPERIHIPRLDRRNSVAVLCCDCLRCRFHDRRICPIPGKCRNPVLTACLHQNLVIFHIIVFLTIMQIHRTDRSCKKRIPKCFSKQGK